MAAARAAEARAAAAERRARELATLVCGEPRQLTRAELAALRDAGPTGPGRHGQRAPHTPPRPRGRRPPRAHRRARRRGLGRRRLARPALTASLPRTTPRPGDPPTGPGPRARTVELSVPDPRAPARGVPLLAGPRPGALDDACATIDDPPVPERQLRDEASGRSLPHGAASRAAFVCPPRECAVRGDRPGARGRRAGAVPHVAEHVAAGRARLRAVPRSHDPRAVGRSGTSR